MNSKEPELIKICENSKFYSKNEIEKFLQSYRFYFYDVKCRSSSLEKAEIRSARKIFKKLLYYYKIEIFCKESQDYHVPAGRNNRCPFQLTLFLSESNDCLVVKKNKFSISHNHTINVSFMK